MNNKFTLGIILGIGIGFIISSGLAILTYQNPKSILEPQTIKSEARKLGMVDPEDYFKRFEQDNKNENQEEKKIVIEIPKGASSEEITKILSSNDLIDSEKEFIDLLKSRQLVNKLKWGRYEFFKDAAPEKIIEMLTK